MDRDRGVGNNGIPMEQERNTSACSGSTEYIYCPATVVVPIGGEQSEDNANSALTEARKSQAETQDEADQSYDDDDY